MKYEILDENGNVLNTIIADIKFVSANFEYYKEIVEAVQENKTKVPQTITPHQCRLQLLALGLLDEVEAIINTDRAMQIWWEYSLEIDRNNEHIINTGIALKLTETQLDDLFIEASKL